MAEKYRVTDIKTGAMIWENMAMHPREAIACAHLDHPEIPEERMEAEIVEFTLPVTKDLVKNTNMVEESAPEVSEKKKPRKTRKDKGQPHKKEPAKRIRSRGQFFVVDRVTYYATRAELDKALEQETGTPFIIQGRELKFERKVQISLKPI